MEIGTQYYFAGCNGKPAGYCTFSETIGDLHCFDMEDGSSIALGQEDMHSIVPMDEFRQMTLDEITAMSRAISSICSACCKPHDTGSCTIVDSQVLCADCLALHLADEHEKENASAYARFMAKPGVKEALLQDAYGVGPKPAHTPEPWHVGMGGEAVVSHSPAMVVAGCRVKGLTYEQNKANAQRIVECVNACAGQSIEDVKLATAHREDVMRWERIMMELVGEDGLGSVRTAIWKLKEDRHELLTALEEAVSWFKQLEDWSGVGNPNLDQYRAAIAKAKGGTNENH